jgi:hypothetical protein
MSIKLAYDLAIGKLKTPTDVKKPIDTQDDDFEFYPKVILTEHLKNMETTDSEVSGKKRTWV